MSRPLSLRRILGHVIDCRTATRLVSKRLEGPLGPIDRLALKLHLAWCFMCARFESQMRFLRTAMQKYRE